LSLFDGLNKDLLIKPKELSLKIKILDTRVLVLKNSLAKVRSDLHEQMDLINNTPSILPTFSTNITSPFGMNITSPFGMRRNPVNGVRQFHDAIDFSGKRGDKIYATAEGVVITTAYHDIRGKYVKIMHKFGFETLYAHLDEILVSEGQKVKKGDIIGTMGGTGRTTGINLHYGVSLYGRKVNPGDYF
jgi:murein DD-endopeptidase MepM/ murein hydrolase activator NlpD